MAKQTTTTVYLIHFNEPLKHAKHYLGFTTDLDKRVTDHLCGMGARLMEVITSVLHGLKIGEDRVDYQLEICQQTLVGEVKCSRSQ